MTAHAPIRRVTTPGGSRDLPEEVPVALVYNGTTQAVMMATPADITDFALGFTLTEGIAPREALPPVEVVAHDTDSGPAIEARMWLPPDLETTLRARRRATVGPVGCGLCGIDSIGQALRPLPPLPEAPVTLTVTDVRFALGELRDWDVATTETVPAWAAAYVEDTTAHPQRARVLQRALRRLRQRARAQRRLLRAQLADPTVVAPLLALATWVAQLPDDAGVAHPPQWAFERLQRWHKRLARALAHAPIDAAEAIEALHTARLLAKRLRYASEAAAGALPAKAAERTQRWQRRARGWQERLGRWRDTLRAADLLATVRAHPGLVGFLRGVAAAQHPLRVNV